MNKVFLGLPPILHLCNTVKTLSLTRLNDVISSVNQISLSSCNGMVHVIMEGPCYNFSGKRSA